MQVRLIYRFTRAVLSQAGADVRGSLGLDQLLQQTLGELAHQVYATRALSAWETEYPHLRPESAVPGSVTGCYPTLAVAPTGASGT